MNVPEMESGDRLALVAAPILAVLMQRIDTATVVDVADSIALAERLIEECGRHVENDD